MWLGQSDQWPCQNQCFLQNQWAISHVRDLSNHESLLTIYCSALFEGGWYTVLQYFLVFCYSTWLTLCSGVFMLSLFCPYVKKDQVFQTKLLVYYFLSSDSFLREHTKFQMFLLLSLLIFNFFVYKFTKETILLISSSLNFQTQIFSRRSQFLLELQQACYLLKFTSYFILEIEYSIGQSYAIYNRLFMNFNDNLLFELQDYSFQQWLGSDFYCLLEVYFSITQNDNFERTNIYKNFIYSIIFCYYNKHTFNIFLLNQLLIRMEREQEQTLSTPGVIQKYQVSAKIANDVLAKLLKKVSVGSKVIDLCVFGDNLIYEQLNKVYNKKPTFKGLAFPTTISVNEVAGHNSPLPEDSTSIKEGDLVKIDLGLHIDGFPAFVGHTLIVKSDNQPVTGVKADVILAAYKAKEAALRLIKPGHTNNQVTAIIAKVCEAYAVNAVEGVISHELKKHLIDGNKVIINKETYDQRVEDQQFAIHDVFSFEVTVSSGEGKLKDIDVRCTIFKRAMDQVYNLKVKQSRQFYNKVLSKYPSFCFSLNAFEDEVEAKLGVKECIQHNLLIPYPVMADKAGSFVASFKTTVMITKGKTTALTGVNIDDAHFKTENSIKDEQILNLLSQSMQKADQKKVRKQETPQQK